MSADVRPGADDAALAPFGWDDAVARRLASGVETARSESGDLVAGRVIRTSRRFTYVATPTGLVATMAPRELTPAPVVGDWVAVWLGNTRGARVEAVAERTTELVRRDPQGRVAPQVLAANVDVVAAVFGLDRPLRPGRIERSLILAHDSGATPLVVLTKADVIGDEARHTVTTEVAGLVGETEIIVLSSRTGAGVDRLAELLTPHRTVVLLGESGAGKSTLVNHLAGQRVQRTAEVRAADAKGRHTTVTRDLIVLERGGVVIDTPGLRALGLFDASSGIAATFDDVEALAQTCRFRDCAHGDEPGCAVHAAVATGDLDPERVARYRAMVDELAETDQAVLEASRRPRGRPPAPGDDGD
jgi:ribosome biogenesis GTPase